MLACFLSTVIPGVCLATLLGVVGMILAQREGVQPLENWVPIYSAPGLKKTWHATPALLLPVIILGGIYGGVMTYRGSLRLNPVLHSRGHLHLPGHEVE